MQLLLKSVANAFDSFEIALGSPGYDITVEILHDIGTLAIGAGFEGVFSLKFEKEGDLFESAHQSVTGYVSHSIEDASTSVICKTKAFAKQGGSATPSSMSTPNLKFYNAAIDAAQSGDIPAAREAIETALTEDPNDVQGWQLYSVILNALGETEKAEKAVAKTKELGLSDADELIMKAADAIGQNKFGLAITHYEDALELDPNRPEVYISYALALMHGDYPSDAEETVNKAVEMAPDDASAWYARGRILRLRGKKNDALESLKKALELQGNLVLARYECGMILAETGELQAALECFEKVLEDHPEDENAISAKAAILAKMEEMNS